MSDTNLSGKLESSPGLSAEKRELLEEKKKALSQELEKNPRQEGVLNEARDKAVVALIATQEMLGEVNGVKGGTPQLTTVAEVASSSSEEAQPEAPRQRWTVMQVKMSPTTKVNPYGDLFTDWLLVHKDNATDLLPFKDAGDAGLKKLLDEWQANGDRVELVKQAKAAAQETVRSNWVEEMSKCEVFTKLIAGLDGQEGTGEKLHKLLANFKSVGPAHFQYTMWKRSSDNFLKGTGTGGDCNTVTHAFRDICQNWLRIPCEIKSSKDVGMPGWFMTPKHTTIDGKTGNVEGKYWAFTEHWWVQCEGTDYDVLFGESGTVDTGSWLPWIETTKEDVEIYGRGSDKIKIKSTGKSDAIEGRYTVVD